MKLRLLGRGNKVEAEFEIEPKEVGEVGVALLDGNYYAFSSMITGDIVLFERVDFREFDRKDAL